MGRVFCKSSRIWQFYLHLQDVAADESGEESSEHEMGSADENQVCYVSQLIPIVENLEG